MNFPSRSDRSDPSMGYRSHPGRPDQSVYAMLHHIPSAVTVLDQEGRIQFANEKAREIFGYAPMELHGRNVGRLVPELKKNDRITELRNWISEGPLNEERSLRDLEAHHRDGTAFFVTLRLIRLLAYEIPLAVGVWEGVRRHPSVEGNVRLQSAALNASANAMVITDREGRILWVNDAFTNLTGYDRSEVLQRNPRLLKSGAHPAEFYQELWETVMDGNVWQGEMVNQRKDGTLYIERQTITPLVDEEGAITHFIAVKEDVTERVQDKSEKERLLQEAQQRSKELEVLRKLALAGTEAVREDALIEAAMDILAGTLDAVNFGLLLLDEHARVLRPHPASRLPAEIGPDSSIRLGQGVTGQVALDGASRRIQDVRQEDAYLVWNPQVRSEMCVPIKTGDRILGVINVESDQLNAYNEQNERLLNTFASQLGTAIEKVRLFEEVQELAIRDPLTRLYNRRQFFHLGVREFDRANRFGHPLSALMLDLDRFKAVNDANGHQVGDQVLVEVANRCRSCIRKIDLLARYGGEEFVALLLETPAEGAMRVAERLRRKISATPIDTMFGGVQIRISVGVAASAEDCPDLEALIGRADQALYVAKRAGRNRSHLWTGTESFENGPDAR